MGNKFGWHSGVLTTKDAKIKGDLYVQDDIVFSDVSAGVLGITGGIDMQETTSAIGIDMGGTHSTAAINIDGTCATNGISALSGTFDCFMNVGEFATPISFSASGKRLVQMYSAFTATSGNHTLMRLRSRNNSASGTAQQWGLHLQTDVMESKVCDEVSSLVCEAVSKADSTINLLFKAGSFKVEDERGTGSGDVSTYSGRVCIMELAGQISSDPTSGYYGIHFDIQSSAGGTDQNLDALLRTEVAGVNDTTQYFLSTGSTIANFGATKTNIISSGTLTGSGTLNIEADARMRVDIGGVDYWIPLYNTAA